MFQGASHKHFPFIQNWIPNIDSQNHAKKRISLGCCWIELVLFLKIAHLLKELFFSFSSTSERSRGEAPFGDSKNTLSRAAYPLNAAHHKLQLWRPNFAFSIKSQTILIDYQSLFSKNNFASIIILIFNLSRACSNDATSAITNYMLTLTFLDL